MLLKYADVLMNFNLTINIAQTHRAASVHAEGRILLPLPCYFARIVIAVVLQ